MDRPQWYYDLCEPDKSSGTKSKLTLEEIKSLPKPSFFNYKVDFKTNKSQKFSKHEDHLKVKRAWELALAPVKSLPMNLLMSYFTGNSLQIMTISMTIYMFFISPLKQIQNSNQIFEPLVSKSIKRDIFYAKIVYILCSLLQLAAGVWKVGQMGLLPTHSTDWIAFEKPAKYFH